MNVNLCVTAGADNFYDAIEEMIGYRPNSWMKWSWMLITPVLCVVRVCVWYVCVCVCDERGRYLKRLKSVIDLSPFSFLLQGCFVFSLVKYKPLTYNKVYEYPDWSIGIGWCLALASMICIPMVVVVKIIQSDGSLIEVSSCRWLVRNEMLCWCAGRGK